MAEVERLDAAAIKEGAARQVAMDLVAGAALVLQTRGVLSPADRTALRMAWRQVKPARWVGGPPAALSAGGVGPP